LWKKLRRRANQMMKQDRPLVLIIDDDAGMRSTLSDILETVNYKVKDFGKGREALDWLKKNSFDIVIMDIKLADIDGMELLAEVRLINPESPVIMMTGYASVETAVEAMKKGAYAYVVKPFNVDEVKAIIQKALHHIRLSKENQRLIDELQLATRKLEKTIKELEKANQIKSRFLASMSHELRTPINAIIGFTDFLLDDKTLYMGQKRDVKRIFDNAQSLLSLVNDILDLSKIEAGKIDLVRRKASIAALAGEVVDNLRFQAEQKGIMLENKIPSSLSETFVDPHRIKQVFINLVGNALKYSKKGGRITLSAEQNKGLLITSVADTGIGIPPEYLDKIFDRFERVFKSSVHGAGGAGLGLSICKELLKLHKGEIWVESKVGKGSKFSFSLPIYEDKDYFTDYLSEQIQEARRQGFFVSLIMVKIENLPQLGKKWGAGTIEELFNQLKNLILNSIRGPLDKVFKYKEGTLAIVLSDMLKDGGQAAKRRLEKIALKHKFEANDMTIKVPLRFREASYPVDGQTEGELIKNAEDIGS
jgi:signal transduction histidine kinase